MLCGLLSHRREPLYVFYEFFKLICLKAGHGVEVHGPCGSFWGCSVGGRGLCVLLWDGGHVYEA